MLFDNLLGKKKSDEALSNTASTNSSAPIQYNPKLVPELRAEHQALLKAIEGLGQAHADGNVAAAAIRLEHFGGQLTAHLLKEDFRLYVYLENALAGDPRTRALVRDFHQEMDGAGKTALAFLAKYRSIAAGPAFPETFAADLAELGKNLQERIDREERILYPMYLPVY